MKDKYKLIMYSPKIIYIKLPKTRKGPNWNSFFISYFTINNIIIAIIDENNIVKIIP